jgi:hypothetical protein
MDKWDLLEGVEGHGKMGGRIVLYNAMPKSTTPLPLINDRFLTTISLDLFMTYIISR